MPDQMDFSNAEAQRLKITQEQQKQIRDLYKKAAEEIRKQAEQAPRVPSDALRQQYLNNLQSQIEERFRDIEGQLNGTISSSMTDTAKATVDDAKAFLQENGLPIKGAYSHVPADIVQSVVSGRLYAGNWSLSRALWLNTAEMQKDIQSVVAQGIIQNKSAYDIAKDLEKYVDPTARKDWDWSKVYPGTRKVVDYNAQRLARTMVSHAYQQAFVRTTQKNPFVSKYKWEASNSERTCEICEERNGKLFDKDDLPLDHPNGMCTFTAVMESLDTIGERLGDWAAGKEDPELDAWAESLYGKDWEQKKEQIDPVYNNDVYHKADSGKYEQILYEGRADLSEEQKRYINEYSVMSGTINSYLRMPEALKSLMDLDPIKYGIPAIDKAIAESSLKENVVVYRTVHLTRLPKDLSPGTIISDKAYNSTSISKNKVQDLANLWNSSTRVTLEILVPAGKGNGIYIADLASDKEQKEFLIKRDAEYKIIRTLPDGTIQVILK